MELFGTVARFDNYLSLISEYPQDVKDEVRGFLLDGVDLGPLLEKHLDDPFLLQQLRVSSKTNMPFWVLKIPYSSVMRSVRNLIMNNISVELVESLVNSKDSGRLSEDHWKALVDLIESGAVIPDDFDIALVSTSMLDFLVWGMKRDFNVFDIASRAGISKKYAMSLLKIRNKGENIAPFLQDQWHIGALEALDSAAGRPYYGYVVGALSEKSSGEVAERLVDLGAKGFDFTAHDLSGLNSIQLSWIYEAHMEALDVTRLVDASLTQQDLVSIYNNLYQKSTGSSYLL